jgi:hypothetical protein
VNLYGFVLNRVADHIDLLGLETSEGAVGGEDYGGNEKYKCCDAKTIQEGRDLLEQRYKNYASNNPDYPHGLTEDKPGYQPQYSCYNTNKLVLMGLEVWNITNEEGANWVNLPEDKKKKIKLRGIPKCWTCQLENGRANPVEVPGKIRKRVYDHWVVVCKSHDKNGDVVDEAEFDFWKNPEEVTPGIDPDQSFRKHYPNLGEAPYVHPDQKVLNCAN